MKLKLCSLFSLAIAFAAAPLMATDYYYWNLTDYGNISDAANWRYATGGNTKKKDGWSDNNCSPTQFTPPARLGCRENFYLDLQNGAYELGVWGWGPSTAISRQHMYLRNGTLTMNAMGSSGGGDFHGGWNMSPAEVHVTSTAKLVQNASGSGPIYFNILSEANKSDSAGKSYIWVEGEFDCYGPVGTRDLVIDVAQGGTMVFSPSKLEMAPGHAWQDPQSENGSSITNNGTLSMPNGLVFNNGAASGNATFDLVQLGGTLNLGGVIKGTTTGDRQNLHLSAVFGGGTIIATGNAAIEGCASIALSGSTTWTVDSGVTVDLSKADSTVLTTPTVTKSGNGTLALPGVVDVLHANGGVVTMGGGRGQSMTSLSVGSGASVVIGAKDATIATLEENTGTITLAGSGLTVSSVAEGADLSGNIVVSGLDDYAYGGTVVTTPVAALRSVVKAAAEAALADAGSSLTVSDTGAAVVIVGGGDACVFNSLTVTDLSVVEGWRNSRMPGEGESAYVGGNGVTGTLTAAALAKGWSGITVQNGATLRLAVDPGALPLNFEAGTTLAVADGLTIAPALAAAAPNLVLEPGATLALADGETCTLSGNVTTEATAQKLSRIVVATNATLSVPAGFVFKNVGLLIDGGTLELSAAGEVTFGGASSGETAYFAMAATNATVKLADGVSGNLGPVQFACPASGGTVVVEDVVDLVRVSFPTVYRLYFGKDNPVSAPFRVVADGTPFNFRERFRVQGAATLEVRNGTVRNAGGNSDDDRFIVEEEGQIVAGENGSFQHHIAGGANTATRIAGSGETDRPAVVLAGGSFRPWCLYSSMAQNIQGGDGHRTLSVSADSFYDLPQVSYWGREDVVFDKLKSVALDAGATLNLRRIDDASWGTSETFFRSAADVPITGAGNVFVTNATPDRPFAVTVQGGANTATGSIAADANSTLLFADGANWAGTVVANGNVALTNGAEAASVSFGTLQLDGDFPVRAWRRVDAETGRKTYVCDALAVGAYTGTGALTPVLMNGDDDECFPFGATLSLGTIGADSAIPRLAKHWRAVVQDGEGGVCGIALRFGLGFSVMVR